MSFFTPPPMYGQIHNSYGVPTHDLVNGRIRDRLSGYDTGLNLGVDWNVYRGILKTETRLDPSTNTFTDR